MDARILQLLIDRAQEHRDDAARLSSQARRERDAAQVTLRTLTEYRDESLNRGPTRSGQLVNVEQIRIAGYFDNRLIAAITQQSGTHADHEERVGERDTELREMQRRLKALETLSQRRASAAEKKGARREQRLLDEFANDIAARRGPGKEQK
ncbi:MAG: flagellar export protein FliJ [Burkholderiales bacterium]